ncbi:MAG TPA: iron ABC transporter permease [Streptosporangiaceae bacterium]|nr:iron ABC transporter permease [Streptosporangiaceae bacterium]
MTSPGAVATGSRAGPGPSGPVTGAPRRAWTPRRRSRPIVLTICSALIAAALALPLLFLLIEAKGAGIQTILNLIFRSLTWDLLWNTMRLLVTVTALSAVLGTAAAWCVERTDLPGRRVWAVLVVVPLAIPDFVVSFGWFSLWSWVQGFRGAVIVMTLAIYPLVYLPVAASLRSADPGQEEVARSLGTGRIRTFARITLGQARGAILGGCLLAALVLLAEYGAFEILGYQTFTTKIFTEFRAYGGFAAACALSLVLVVISMIMLAGEALARGRGRVSRSGPLAQRQAPPHKLGRARWPVLAGFAALVLLALGVPVYSSIYWMLARTTPGITGGMPLLTAAWHTAIYGVLAASLATLAALPIALLAVRHAGRVRLLLERSTFLVLGMPGIVIAFALSYFVEIYVRGIGYGSALVLITCYAIMFFPLALVGVKASLARAPVRLDEIARSLGQRKLAVLWRVTLQLAGPGLAAAFCLVFLSVVTELTATLLLIPTGVQTLATQFWEYESNLSYGQAAPFALVMIAVAAVPSYVLGRFFDRSAQARG